MLNVSHHDDRFPTSGGSLDGSHRFIGLLASADDCHDPDTRAGPDHLNRKGTVTYPAAEDIGPITRPW